ncbi:hypothetical protein D9615_003648 [Tricholomella constricta]|uniref:Uncharacterized protein n=1 Tax=Tricholomella constricta TaxID=117010 RepID=A0A8H5HHL0_9AGAR|nr:hypothetical protein D9615_003648 [Tricholomella constricta]
MEKAVYVETSDSGEEELHYLTDPRTIFPTTPLVFLRDDTHSPWKRRKLHHRECSTSPAPATPLSSSCSVHVPPTSSSLCPEDFSGNTPTSSSLVNTPSHTGDVQLIWTDDLSQDPLNLLTQGDTKHHELDEDDMLDITSSPSLVSDLDCGAAHGLETRFPSSGSRSHSSPPHSEQPSASSPQPSCSSSPRTQAEILPSSHCEHQLQEPSEPSSDRSTSLLTPPPRSQNLPDLPAIIPPQDLSGSPNADRAVSVSDNEETDEQGVAGLHNADANNAANTLRRSERERTAYQLKPYTVDALTYEKLLEKHQDAIVKMKDFSSGRARYERYDPSDDDDAEQDDSGNERRRSQRKYLSSEGAIGVAVGARADSGDEQIQYTGILQGLPSTDEEEENRMRETAKEAKRAKLEKARKAKEATETREKMKVQQRSKPFPLKDLDANRPRTQEKRKSRSLSLAPDHPPFPRSPRRRRSDTPGQPVTPIRHASSPSAPTSSNDPADSHPPSPGQISDDFQPRHVDDADDESNGEGEPREDLDADVDSEDEGFSPKRNARLIKGYKSLKKLYPTSMLENLINGNFVSKKALNKLSASEHPDNEDDDNAQLLPGQSKTRRSNTIRENKDIKGDTESSDDDRASAAGSDPPRKVLSGRTPSDSDSGRARGDGYRRAEFMELTDSSGGSSSEDSVDDVTIQAHLASDTRNRNFTSGPSRREENLIDYMLSRTTVVRREPITKIRSTGGGTHRRGATSKSSKYKVDVTTRGVRGADHTRQTKLNFKSTSHIVGSRHNAPSSSRRAPTDVEDHQSDNDRDRVHPVPEFNASKKRSRKERARGRRARAKGQGQYTFASGDTRIVTGRSEAAMVTIYIEEDEEFHKAIVPLSQEWARPPSTRKVNPDHDKPMLERVLPRHHDRIVETTQHLPKPKPHSIRGDVNIPVLHSGLRFGDTTYIGKGWLHELVHIVSCPTTLRKPMAVTLQGIELEPTMDINSYLKSLNQIFHALFNIITNQPMTEGADEEYEWRPPQRAASQLLSWILSTATESDAKILRDAVQEQTSNFVSRIRDQSLKVNSISTFTLSICWFAVELSARLGLSLATPASNALDQSAALLVHCLLEFGFEQTMLPILNGAALDSSTVAQYAAELWVCLFHLADKQCDQGEASAKENHPFLSIVKKALEDRRDSAKSRDPTKSCLTTSEVTWRMIFSLCALTQFSVHGMTIEKSRLPACWDLVVCALKEIRLTADPVADCALSPSGLDKRDKYIGLITVRCFHLWSRWHWPLEDASALFSQLVEIFRSRKFAGLRHERPDYPSFMTRGQWGLLKEYEPRDTAFVLFLKLIVQAVGCDESNSNRSLSPRAKKLLSMAIPVGSLPFSKKTPTVVQDLSMLYNRLGAMVMGIYLDPTSHVSRIAHARKYVDFSDADETTRVAVIRGIMYLAIVLMHNELSLHGIKEWIEGIVTILVEEFKSSIRPEHVPMTAEEQIIQSRIHFSVQLLVGSVRQVFKAYQVKSEYPEPILLGAASLRLIPKGPLNLINAPRTSEEIRKMLQAFLDARKLALPPPERPRIVLAPESQESQYELSALDINVHDPAALAQFDVNVQAAAPPDFAAKEMAVRSCLNERFIWWACSTLTNRVQDPKSDIVHINRWLDCWLGIVDVARHGGDKASQPADDTIAYIDEPFSKTWAKYLTLVDQWQVPENRRPVRSCIMKKILKIDPMNYVIYKDEYIKILMTTLVSAHSTLEREFVALLLSIDGCQHPLLLGLFPDVVGVDDGSQYDPKDILRVIMRNLASLQQEDGSLETDCQKFIGFCIDMFQAMNNTRLTKDLTLPEARREYVGYCRSVVQIVQEHQGLREHSRLVSWMAWGRDLN